MELIRIPKKKKTRGYAVISHKSGKVLGTAWAGSPKEARKRYGVVNPRMRGKSVGVVPLAAIKTGKIPTPKRKKK